MGRHKVRLPDGGMPKGPYACYARKLTSPERQTLRQRNPEFGYRDTREVAAAADEVGLKLASTTRMPANNLLLEFVRS